MIALGTTGLASILGLTSFTVQSAESQILWEWQAKRRNVKRKRSKKAGSDAGGKK